MGEDVSEHCDEDLISDTPFVPDLLDSSSSTFNSSCIPSGLVWAPTGDHLAVAGSDAAIRLFSPSSTSLGHPTILKETEYIYSMCWCPRTGRRLAVTGRYQPVHIWQIEDGKPSMNATYKCINQLDELSHAFSVVLDSRGEMLYCGLKGEVRVFEVSRPGRESRSHSRKELKFAGSIEGSKVLSFV